MWFLSTFVRQASRILLLWRELWQATDEERPVQLCAGRNHHSWSLLSWIEEDSLQGEWKCPSGNNEFVIFDSNDKSAKIGETWTGSNPCKQYSCVEKDGEAKSEYNLEKCPVKCEEVRISMLLLFFIWLQSADVITNHYLGTKTRKRKCNLYNILDWNCFVGINIQTTSNHWMLWSLHSIRLCHGRSNNIEPGRNQKRLFRM